MDVLGDSLQRPESLLNSKLFDCKQLKIALNSVIFIVFLSPFENLVSSASEFLKYISCIYARFALRVQVLSTREPLVVWKSE